jgi:colanic acid biosynthesis glycosyl transferase WcaI
MGDVLQRGPTAELHGASPERLHLGEGAAAEPRIGTDDSEVADRHCVRLAWLGEPLSSLAVMAARTRLLVLNQYYWPGVEATANLLTELCEALGETHDVTVITGASPGLPARQVRNGVEIVRVRSTTFDRSRLFRRALNYVSYVVGLGWRAMFTRRPDLVVSMTDPPFIGSIARAVAARFRVPLLIVMQDVFPEIAVKLGRLKSPVSARLLRLLIDPSLRAADRVVVIGQTMKRRVEEKGVSGQRIRVIPNWGDVVGVVPMPHENEWSRRHRLTKRFVVMHSGNIGHAQNLDALVRAATFLRDLDDLAVVIIGTGARRAQLIQLARLLETDKVEILPFQERSILSQSLSTADVHVVGLAKGLAGYVVPSRLYGILAAGRPVIAATDPESETAQLVAEVGCGVLVPPGNPLALADAIRAAHDGEYDLVEMGRRARAFAEAEGDRSIAVRRYLDVLGELEAAGAR